MPSLKVEPNAGAGGGGQGLLGNLISQMRGAGIDLSGNTPATEEQKQAMRNAGVSVNKKGGKVSSASSRADGCCTKGKTRGRMV